MSTTLKNVYLLLKTTFSNIRENNKFLRERWPVLPFYKYSQTLTTIMSYIGVVYAAFEFYGHPVPKEITHYFFFLLFLKSIISFYQGCVEMRFVWTMRKFYPYMGPFDQFGTFLYQHGWVGLKKTAAVAGGILSAHYGYAEYFGMSPLNELSQYHMGFQTKKQLYYHLTHPLEYKGSELLPWQVDSQREVTALHSEISQLKTKIEESSKQAK